MLCPIETIHLFPVLSAELITLLKRLNEAEWQNPSPLAGRSVKDLVSHLVDGSLRKLSLQRDHFIDGSMVPSVASYSDLVSHIQRLNRDWIEASRRLSPAILIDLFTYAEAEFHHFISGLDPHGLAIFPVAWAGETTSENWFDIAREYTERWHHQMQIRLALQKPLLLDRQFTEPLYDTFMLALPFLYRDVKQVQEGYTIGVTLTGTLNKQWVIERNAGHWDFTKRGIEVADTHVRLPDDAAWLLFTNTERNKEQYKATIRISGDEAIGLKILNLVTVMS